jgi:hypothetical protein
MRAAVHDFCDSNRLGHAPPQMAPAVPEARTWVLMLAGLSVLLSAVFRPKA